MTFFTVTAPENLVTTVAAEPNPPEPG